MGIRRCPIEAGKADDKCSDYGARMEAWDKCEDCPKIENCSALSLVKVLSGTPAEKRLVRVVAPDGEAKNVKMGRSE